MTLKTVQFLMVMSLAFGCARPEQAKRVARRADSFNAGSQRGPNKASAQPTLVAFQTPTKKKKKPRPTQSLDELMLFFPTPYPKGNWRPQGLEFEDVWFTAKDMTRIHGWFCPCKNSRAVVLYAHGNAGNLSHRQRLLRRLHSMRLAVLIFDYRGYGRSKGTPTAAGVIQDTRAAAKFLAKRAKIKESQMVLMGRSLGGALVTELASTIQPRGLILESSFSSLKDIASHHYPKLSWLVPGNKLNSASVIARYKGPLLQSHGDRDRTIPFALGKKLFQAANKPKLFVTIPGGDHNDSQPASYYQALDRFIARHE